MNKNVMLLELLTALTMLAVTALQAADEETSVPTTTFTPSETITAESAVSFPVDI